MACRSRPPADCAGSRGSGPLASKNVSASLAAYKSIDVGAYAHHVLALRVAGGASAGHGAERVRPRRRERRGHRRAPGHLARDRAARSACAGFPVGVESGEHIVAGSLEYRLPLTQQPSTASGLWPVFLDRTSLSLFGDAGSASGGFGHAGLARGSTGSHQLARSSASISRFHTTCRTFLRIGVAAPVTNHSGAPCLRDAVRAARLLVLSLSLIRERVVNIDSSAYIHPLAAIIGDVTIGPRDRCGRPR